MPDLIATARRFAKKLGGQWDLRLTNFESLATAEVEPLCFEASRAGRRFYVGYSAAVTGKAPVQAVATTAAQWVLFNNEAQGSGKSYAIESVGAYVTSGTPGVGGILWGTIFTLPVASASDSGIAVQNASNSSLASKAIVKSSVSITTPAAPTWFPLAENDSSNVGAFPGSATLKNRELRGSLVIPPQCGLGLYVLALAGTSPLWAPWAMWCELDADLE